MALSTLREVPLSRGACVCAASIARGEVPYGRPIYIRMRTNPNLVWDLYGGSDGDGTPLQLYPFHGGPSQQFVLYLHSNSIVCMRSNKALGIRTGTQDVCVRQWDRHDKSPNQQLLIIADGDLYRVSLMQQPKLVLTFSKLDVRAEAAFTDCDAPDRQAVVFELVQ